MTDDQLTQKDRFTVLSGYLLRSRTSANRELHSFLISCLKWFDDTVFEEQAQALKISETFKQIYVSDQAKAACSYLSTIDPQILENSNEYTYKLFIDLAKCAYEDYNNTLSINHLFKALEIAKELEGTRNKAKVAHVYRKLAWKFYDQQLWEKSREFLNAATELFKSLDGPTNGLGSCYSLKARLLMQDGDLDGALSTYEQAKKVFRSMDNFLDFHTNMRTQGEFLVKNGQIQSGMDSIVKAQDYYMALGIEPYVDGTWLKIFTRMVRHDINSIRIPVGDQNATLSRKRIADTIRMRIDTSSEIDHRQWRNTAFIQYYEAVQPNTDSLNKYLKLQLSLREHLQQKYAQGQMRLVSSTFKTIEQEQEINQSQDRIEELKQSETAFARQLTGAIVLLVLLGGLVYYYRRNNKNHRSLLDRERAIAKLEKSRRAEQDKLISERELNRERQRQITELNLENERQEKEILALELEAERQRQMATLLQIKEKEALLQEIESVTDNNQRDIPELKKLKSKLKVHQDTFSETDSIINSYQQTNPNFFTELGKLNGGMTDSEKQLATLIHLGYNSSKLASMLNSNVKTINQRKYRLKKKLKLAKEEKLVNFLKNL